MDSGFTVMSIEIPEGSNYTITGPDCQILNVTLKTGEALATEPGSMMFMSNDIKSTVECGSCSRTCVGESICKSTYTNQGSADGFVAVTPNFPAKIVPVDLSRIKGKLIAKNGSYMSSLGDVKTTINFDCNPISCCFGGMGMTRQQLEGTGTAFLTAGGTIMKKQLKANEKIQVDTDSVVAYEETATMGIKRAGGCCTMLCGGEGMFNTTLKGPGMVYMQSMSFEKYRLALAPPLLHNSQNSQVV